MSWNIHDAEEEARIAQYNERAASAQYLSDRARIEALTKANAELVAEVERAETTNAELQREIEGLREAADFISPYLRWTVSDESPGHHPTMPSAVAAFHCSFDIETAEKRMDRLRRPRAALTGDASKGDTT